MIDESKGGTATVLMGVCLTEHQRFTLDELSQACGTEVTLIQAWVAEGLLEPQADEQGRWHFGGHELSRAQRLRRLSRDFDASARSVGLIVELLDEIERLHCRLLRAGVRIDDPKP